MKKRTLTSTIMGVLLLVLSVTAYAELTKVPDPFTGSSPGSTYSIIYNDVNSVLRNTVVNTGRSSREKSAPTQASTGTRMKVTVKRATVNEANRFYFEAFEGDKEATELLQTLRKNLESIPDQVPLGAFNRNEQLAYWLNLYNITLIDEIVKIYPQRSLKKYLTGKKSILKNQVLTVGGVPLSLNDIEFILRKNYKSDPLVIYGMFQGNIGGPNIRRVAYTGKNVYKALEDNAEEFINSNRGTYSKDEKTFRVSSLYERDEVFFAGDEALKKHLLQFVEGPERQELEAASRIKRDIDDWSMTDLHGSSRNLAGSFASNKSALIDSVTANQPGNRIGTTVATNFSNPASSTTSMEKSDTRFSADLVIRLQEINARRDSAAQGNATVTVEELGQVEVKPTEPDNEDGQ